MYLNWYQRPKPAFQHFLKKFVNSLRPTAVWPRGLRQFVSNMPLIWAILLFEKENFTLLQSEQDWTHLFHWGITSFDHNRKALSDIIIVIKRYHVTSRPATCYNRRSFNEIMPKEKKLAWLAIVTDNSIWTHLMNRLQSRKVEWSALIKKS